MKHILIAGAACTAASLAQAQSAPDRGCANPVTRDAGENTRFLSQRAIEIVERARASGWRDDAALRALIAPDAQFTLGSGDVSEILDPGIAGARALSTRIGGDSFRYVPRFGYAAGPFDACADQWMTVEFINNAARIRVAVVFRFHEDLLVEANGLSDEFVAGPLKPIGQR